MYGQPPLLPQPHEDLSLIFPPKFEIINRQVNSDFYVLPNPLAVVLVPYGLYLVFYGWLSPSSIPSNIPLGQWFLTFYILNFD